MTQTGSTQGVSVINVNDTNNDAKQAAAHLWLGKESDGLDLELPIRTLLYEPKRNDLLKHLTAKTREVPEGGGDTKNTDTNSTDFSSPGIDDMNEASKIKCKKNSWVCWPHGWGLQHARL